ncbi:hypothetical protein [Sorangium sp. So ce394]|uniref:hypothetical protein n=1 Tax=Sorangium sp. So ce394 TaxID=3133310 RepID=UPI003F5C8102
MLVERRERQLSPDPSLSIRVGRSCRCPQDCLTAELSTLEPNGTVELTWDRRVFERRDLPAECRGGPDSPASCDQLVAIEEGTLTVHLRFWNGQDCSDVDCIPTGEETKEETFSSPVAGPGDITID